MHVHFFLKNYLRFQLHKDGAYDAITDAVAVASTGAAAAANFDGVNFYHRSFVAVYVSN